MKRSLPLLAAILLLAAGTAHALYSLNPTGDWPKSWPKELEPLRKQSRTLNGPHAPQLHYGIRFNTRDEFEAAWPHIVTLKGKGRPIYLVRGENFFLGGKATTGVVLHEPSTLEERKPAKGENENAYHIIELVVDGTIVDLNRIPLPADTPIIDKRFEEKKK